VRLLSPVGVRDAGEIESGHHSIRVRMDGGLIATPSAAVSAHHDLIVMLAARYTLPTSVQWSLVAL